MKQYLLSIYQPDGVTPPPEVLEEVMRNVYALNDEMKAAGVWVMGSGLHPASSATVLRHRDDRVLVTDGPYIEAKEHIGGFTIIQATDSDAALGWARKLARVLSPLAIEVRPMRHHGDDRG